MPFRVAQKILADCGFPKGQSWAAIAEKLEEDDVRKRADYTRLEAALIETLIVSEKSLALFRLGEDEMKSVYKGVDQLAKNLPDSSFRETFPYALSEQELWKANADPVPVAVYEWEKVTAVVFCGPRVLETREELPASAFDGGDRYASIIGIRRTVVQSYSAVVIPHIGNTIEVFIDAPSDVPDKPIELDHFAAAMAFNKAINFNALKGRINLFPAISPLYTSEEGMVSHLGHTVSTSVKHEKMRGAGRCVRQELFHAGGFKAVDGQITPFSIGVVWGLDDETSTVSNPSLNIEGTYMMTYQSNPVVDIAAVRKCASYEDASFVVDRLLAHIP